ncbi:hypothetical protein [Carboxylicivirga marina]|uniref:DUF4377 domain-containing protein n=1 Tax=Carboxylicivirga marina TaxID=2800988 RepID=A0ABS1HFV0_9BACT|nr:hypothetical protein [Carboxylicivirga marina]MBK3516360.1 hypothetical protein [Carboxylicivirga marina]
MKRVQFIKVLFVTVMMLGFSGAFNAFSQSNEQHLPCLKKVYLVSDGDVLLDCKPEESRYIAHKNYEWTVNKYSANNKAGAELKGCIEKKNGKFYLNPSEIFKKVKDKQVVVVYKQLSADGSVLTLYYQIKVVTED